MPSSHDILMDVCLEKDSKLYCDVTKLNCPDDPGDINFLYHQSSTRTTKICDVTALPQGAWHLFGDKH